MLKANYLCCVCALLCTTGVAQDMKQVAMNTDFNDQEAPPQSTPALPASIWQYGAFVDAAYLLDFNHPANDLFRSRGTAYKVDEPLINMTAVYLQKNTSESSRWGLQLTVQAGQDTRIFRFSATAPNLPGSRWLRHLGPTNFSYLAPLGK